jgi:enoyl-CoA hydratase/carnithine racemase
MTVLFELDDQVAVVTLHRPEVRNAFNGEMSAGLAEALARADEADDIRAVVVTGTPPAFCAGADMTSGGSTFAKRDEKTFSAAALSYTAWQVRKPVIAAVNGHAIGVGLTITFHCDIRIFAEDATYGVVQTRRGVMGDAYSHWTLPRIVGMGPAADILLTGRTFDGREAYRLGLCNRVLPNHEVLPAALEIAKEIATNAAPLSVAYSKQLLWDSWSLSLAEVEARETEYHHYLMAHDDAREGVMAFLERRPPQWKGRVSEPGGVTDMARTAGRRNHP